MGRWVRVLIVLLPLGVFALGVIAMRDVRALVGQPWPGFGVLPNGEVGPVFLSSTSMAPAPDAPRFQERVLAVDGQAASGPGALRRRLSTVPPGTRVEYTVETADGRREQRTSPVPTFTQQDFVALLLPLFFGATLGLFLGTVPVLARPRSLTTWLYFLFHLGLSVNFGYLALDYFIVHRFVPWGVLGGALATSTLIHLALLVPEPLPIVRRFPRAVPALAYLASALVWAGWTVALFRAPPALRVLDGAEVGLFAVGAAIFGWNLVRAARRSGDAATRQLARVLGTGSAVTIAAGAALLFAALFRGPQAHLPIVVHLLPVWGLGLLFTWAMVAHNLFALDALVRRCLAAALVTLAALALQAAAFLVLRPFVDGTVAWIATGAAAVLAVSVASIAARIPAGLESMVERALFPRLHVARAVVHEAGRELVRHRDEAGIATVIRQALDRSLAATWARLVAGPPGQPLVEVAPIADPPLEVPPRDPLYAFAAATHAVRLELPGQRGGPSRAARARGRQLGAHLVVPLRTGNGVEGMLLLGPRADGRLYTGDDEVLAETLVAQAAIAVEHARAWAKVEELERRLRAENLYLREEIEERTDEAGEMVGRSAALRRVLAQVERVAATDAAVLVQGETGTGKELLVRALHAHSARRDRVLVRVACAALPETLLESELFGHERGAFTGAVAVKPGRLEVADGGTLFLDDVDTLPLGVQAKLLRALQEGEVQRLGSNRLLHVDVRVVAATNRDLLAEVRAGRFREDLYYRLDVVPLRLPPLRDRLEDIPLLVEHLIRQDGPRLNPAVRGVSAEMLAALAHYHWPGNVRELRNVVQRALVLAHDEVLRLPAPLGQEQPESATIVGPAAAGSLAEQLRALKVRLITEALGRASGNQRVAAEALGMHRQSLTRMIRDLGLQTSADEREEGRELPAGGGHLPGGGR